VNITEYKKDLRFELKWEHMFEGNQVGMCGWIINLKSRLNKNARRNAMVIVNASDG